MSVGGAGAEAGIGKCPEKVSQPRRRNSELPEALHSCSLPELPPQVHETVRRRRRWRWDTGRGSAAARTVVPVSGL